MSHLAHLYFMGKNVTCRLDWGLWLAYPGAQQLGFWFLNEMLEEQGRAELGLYPLQVLCWTQGLHRSN